MPRSALARAAFVCLEVGCCAGLAPLALAEGKPDPDMALLRVVRRQADDLARLRATGIPVVRETLASLFVEGPLALSSRLAADGYEVKVLDLEAASADYWQIGLRPDTDVDLLQRAGIVVWDEEGWLLLRVPRGLEAALLHDAHAWLSPLPHEPVDAPRETGETLLERAEGLPNPLIQKMVAAATPAVIDRYWSDIVANPPSGTRFSLAPGAHDAVAYCKNELAAAGVPAAFSDYNPNHPPNVVGELRGAVAPERIFIAIAHVDDLPADGLAPGANDNASGSANILTAAKAMSCWPFRNTVRFIACTGEEQGLYGSDAYAAEATARGDDIRGVLNFDMIGWQGDGLPDPENLDLYYNTASQDLAQVFAQSATAYATGLAVDAFLCPSATYSDHASFWERGYKAISGITDNEGFCGHAGNYPQYHKSTDTLENCGHRGFFYSVVGATVATLATLGEPFKVTFGSAAAACESPARVVLGDRDLNTNPALAETVAVQVWSSRETAPETIVLTEEGPDSMLFSGPVPTTTAGPVAGDGTISVAHGDTLSVRYVDALDCDGAAAVPYAASVPVDCLRPLIADVHEEGVTDVAATIAWTTDEPSDSTVVSGRATPPAEVTYDGEPVTAHAVTLAGLTPCTTYSYEVRSADPAGNVGTSDNGSHWFRFETKDAAQNSCHAGTVELSRPAVACSDTLTVRLSDMDLNRSPAAVETVTVTVSSTSEPDAEPLVLTETGPDSSRFEGQIPVASGAAAPTDGILQVAPGDVVTATYHDADDGTGAAAVSTTSGTADCAGPGIPSIVVKDLTERSAVVEWTTSETATARIDWGPTPALGTAQTGSAPGSTHTFTLSPLTECGRVYFKLTATDPYGNVTVDDLGGRLHQFNALTVPGTVFRENFEGPSTWTLEGEWQIGQPQGKGTSLPDPTAAYEGQKVLGHDLTGLGTYPGDYEPSKTESAASPVIDASGLQRGQLRFHRWLNARSVARASIEVYRNGVWNEVWRSSNAVNASASSWTEQNIDISRYADGNPQLRIQFKQAGGFTGNNRSGWNIDRLIVRDAAAPDYAACGGCGGAPSFGGAAGVADDDPCAAGRLTVHWQPASAWGTGASGTYAVYRSADPAFVPSAATLLAAGVAGTSYVDAVPPAGTRVHYIVRAENGETCGGGPANGGVVDGNLVRLAASDASGQPAPGAVGPSLRVREVNGAHVRLSWSAAPAAASYHVRRSEGPAGSFQVVGDVAQPLFEDLDEVANEINWFYDVRTADACGNEGP